jgi:hypothetical protein
MLGVPIPYEYDVQGYYVTITTEFLGGSLTGRASKGWQDVLRWLEAEAGQGRRRKRGI